MFDQVSTKQTELGIGQTSYVSYRFKVVDYLPWMYVYEFIMQSKRPDPIQSYETIIYPFGYYVWAFAFAFTVATLVVLMGFQWCWSKFSGEPFPRGWLWEGRIKVYCIMTHGQTSLLNCY